MGEHAYACADDRQRVVLSDAAIAALARLLLAHVDRTVATAGANEPPTPAEGGEPGRRRRSAVASSEDRK